MDSYQAKPCNSGSHSSESLDSGESISDTAEEPPSAIQIPIANQQTSLVLDEQKLRAAVQSVLEDSSFETAVVSVAVVDDPTIHQLNRQFLQHDYPTDILSFVLDESQTHLEGELIASSDTAIQNAAEYGWSSENELLLYLIHGALHLVGFRDKNAEERAAMHEAEAAQLKKLGLELPKNRSRWQQDTATRDGVPKP